MPIKLNTASGGGVTLSAANTATDKTITVPADDGTMIYANSSGNVGIGTSSPVALLDVRGKLAISNGAASYWQLDRNDSDGSLQFLDGTTERARIDSSGNLLVGTTSGAQKLVVSQAASAVVSGYFISSSATTAYGIQVTYTGKAPNNTGEEFIYCNDTSAARFVARSNGGLANYSANNVNLSDRREKTNFAPAKSYLKTICAIPVQTFNYIDQNHEEDPGLTLGVVAQDVQEVAPELVMESNWGSKEEPKMRLSVYQTDLQYALMKCIQEQQQMIETLQAKVAALEAQ